MLPTRHTLTLAQALMQALREEIGDGRFAAFAGGFRRDHGEG